MRRRVLFVLVAIALLCCVLGALVACESYKADPIANVGNKNAKVESNGGLVVRQGDYLYFVNGYTGYLTDNGEDNWFGNVTKGAIVRVSYKDGKIGEDYTVVVPKSVMASSSDVGFSIFGEYIYYVSPSPDESRDGKTVKTDTLQFLRTKIDGTDTQLILSVGDNSVRYKYTSKALFWYDSSDAENKLYAKDLTKKSFKKSDKGTVIAEDVASVYFPKSENYDPEKGTIADCILYTKNSKLTYDNTNILYIATPDGSVNKELIGANTYDKKYNISVIADAMQDGKLTIYYTKTSYVGTSSDGTVVGTFAYQIADASAAFDVNNEKTLTSEGLSSVYAVGNEGLFAYGSDTNTVFYKNDGTIDLYGKLQMSTLVAMDDTYFFYLNSSGRLLRFAKDDQSNACYAYDEDKNFMTSFIAAEYYEGYIFGIIDDDYDYMYYVDLATISAIDPSAVTFKRIGILTEEDETKIKEAEEKDED